MTQTDLTWRAALILEIEALAKKCQELFEEGDWKEDSVFDDFIEKWDFNSRYGPSPFAYKHMGSTRLVDMKVELLMVYIEMKLS